MKVSDMGKTANKTFVKYAYPTNPLPGGYNWATLFLGEINTGT
jgi:hypothetical protein